MKSYEYLLEFKDKAVSNVKKLARESGVLDKKTKQVGDEMGRTEKKAQKMGNSFGHAERKSIGLSKSLGSALSVAKGFAASAAVVGMLMLGSHVSSAGAKAEQTKVSFETMLGSVDRANSALSGLNEFANATPFTNDEVVTSGRNLLAFGVTTEKLIPTLRNLGDVASGLNIPFNELSEIYGKIKVSQTVYSEDLNQLAGRGIPIFTELSKVMGVQSSKVKKLASEGKIGFKEIEKSFQNMTTKGGLFFNLMEKQSAIFGGKVSTIQGKLGLLSEQYGKSLNKSLKPLLDIAISGIDSLIKKDERHSGVLRRKIAISDGLFSALKRGNIDQNERKNIIEKINERYSDYLPNLIKEKDGLNDIAKAHKAVKEELEQRLASELKAESQKDLLTKQANLLARQTEITLQKSGIASIKDVNDPQSRSEIAKAFGLPSSSKSDVSRLSKNIRLSEEGIAKQLAEVKKSLSNSDSAFDKVFGLDEKKKGKTETNSGSGNGNSGLGNSISKGIDGIASGGGKNITINFGGVKVADDINIMAQDIQDGIEQLEPKMLEVLARVLNGTLHTAGR